MRVPNLLDTEFVDSAEITERVLTNIENKLANLGYSSIVRQVPYYLVDSPEYLVLLEKGKDRYFGSNALLFEPEGVLRHISSVLDVKKTLAVNLNYLETLSDDSRSMCEYLVELCEKCKGIIYICSSDRPGKITTLLFRQMQRHSRDFDRFQKEKTIVPMLASGFLKTIDMAHKAKNEVRPIKTEISGNTMYYYYKAMREL